jgi:hypothetical protein
MLANTYIHAYIYTYTHIDIYTYILIHCHIDTYALRGLIYY